MTQAATSVQISQLMEESAVKFGTSGARGLVKDMTDRVCYAYTMAFLQHLSRLGEISQGDTVGIAYDYRPSSPGIVAACCRAITDFGCSVINAGLVPTPAIALYGIQHQIPTLMVTGSHIPDDRNGIKFYRPGGEILKSDENAIKGERVRLSNDLFTATGELVNRPDLKQTDNNVYEEYIDRYIDFFPENALNGLSIAVYQHSSVASRALIDCLNKLGAKTIPLAHSDTFIPVDTEAVREEDIELARRWAEEYQIDAIVSTDGDGDRPLIGNEQGVWLRGDIVGILCARYLRASTVVTPVSSNTAAEMLGEFEQVIRTRIGSPYVIEAMQSAAKNGEVSVVGYEANGGFLNETAVNANSRTLSPLPTRDAVLPILAIIHAAKKEGKALSALVQDLPSRITYSDRIKEMPTALSLAKLNELKLSGAKEFLSELQKDYSSATQGIKDIDDTDGLRITLNDGNIFHLRPSGNAPELRCYTEADNEETAKVLNQACMNVMQGWHQS